MSMELVSVLVYVSLIFVAVVVQANYAALTAGLAFGFSNRDTAQPGKGPAGHRIDRTVENLKEGGIQYLPLAILAISTDTSNPWTYYAALITILSRLLYVPVYWFGVRVVRTAVWVPGLLAIPAMAYGIVSGLASNFA